MLAPQGFDALCNVRAFCIRTGRAGVSRLLRRLFSPCVKLTPADTKNREAKLPLCKPIRHDSPRNYQQNVSGSETCQPLSFFRDGGPDSRGVGPVREGRTGPRIGPFDWPLWRGWTVTCRPKRPWPYSTLGLPCPDLARTARLATQTPPKVIRAAVKGRRYRLQAANQFSSGAVGPAPGQPRPAQGKRAPSLPDAALSQTPPRHRSRQPPTPQRYLPLSQALRRVVQDEADPRGKALRHP